MTAWMRWAPLVLLTACPPPEDTATGDTEEVDPLACPFDEAEGPESAASLAIGATAEGYLCPVGDQDWLTVDHPGGLLQVNLAIEGTVAPVEPTWTVWDGAAETVVAGPEPDEAARAGAPMSLWHAAPAGTLLIQVRDQGNDNEDVRHPWSLRVESRDEPDAHEPNDETPVVLPASPVTGVVASRGDVDAFTLAVAAQQLVSLNLSVPAGGYDPALTITDDGGAELLSLVNPAGRREATDLSWTLAVETATTLTLTIADDTNREHDPDTAWTLTYAVGSDPDLSEPNDHPDEAVDLGTGACGGGWDNVADHTGYVATSGDVDWLEVGLSSCGRGLLEATLDFDEAVPLPDGFVPTLRVVREVSGQACSIDQECAELDATCRDGLDCEGLGNTCLGNGQCAGAAVCLPTGNCGANLLVERAPEATPDRVVLSAPLVDHDKVWLAVSEQGGDALAPTTPYALSVRTRTDPDAAVEPNNVYTAGPPTSSAANRHSRRAVELEVKDCRPRDPDTDDTDVPEPECCDSASDYVTGHLANAYDQDWFKYAHPCPGEDCMVRLHIEHDAGPVDVFAQVYRGTSLWYDEILGTTDMSTQPSRSVAYGGLDPSDECFYAYQGHSGDPFWYHVAVRDTVYKSRSDPTGGTWDWSPDQAYRICVEVIADGCAEPPCKLFSDGCGSE